MIILSAYGAAVTTRAGLELSYQQVVDTSLFRMVSLTPVKAKAAEVPTKKKEAAVPFFTKPAKGTNWGVIHANNGVDIANTCGTPVVSAAAGRVTDIGAGWNGGYGNAVTITHANKTKTFYAHLEEVAVEIGQKVAQGEQVGVIGMTGKSTGCHLHFEVHGGKNPFGK